MTVLSDKWIKKAASRGMIKPFVDRQVRKGKISFGLSSYGYDARVSNEFKIFTNVNSASGAAVNTKSSSSWQELKPITAKIVSSKIFKFFIFVFLN